VSQRFLQIAVVYLFLGALLGITMGVVQNFALVPVHAHVLLLGWVSLALFGVIYHLHPLAAKTRLARLHFWIHNIALPVFMVSLAFYITGQAFLMGIVIVAGLLVLIGLGLFTANVLINVKVAHDRP
jgi:cbb3-type cytochrome oxidase subunit 1